MIINIVIDASGSMAEDGKNAVVKYFLNGVINSRLYMYTDQEKQFNLYQWGKETLFIPSIETAGISYAGKADCAGLEELERLISKEQPLILVSDGNFERKEIKKLKELSNNILPIFVGCDANRSVLLEISTNKTIYSIVDFLQAICDA